jgi:hypothetical protein
MGVYRRGKTWWYVFEFQGRRIQESSGFTNKTAALRAEAQRKNRFIEQARRIHKGEVGSEV